MSLRPTTWSLFCILCLSDLISLSTFTMPMNVPFILDSTPFHQSKPSTLPISSSAEIPPSRFSLQLPHCPVRGQLNTQTHAREANMHPPSFWLFPRTSPPATPSVILLLLFFGPFCGVPAVSALLTLFVSSAAERRRPEQNAGLLLASSAPPCGASSAPPNARF